MYPVQRSRKEEMLQRGERRARRRKRKRKGERDETEREFTGASGWSWGQRWEHRDAGKRSGLQKSGADV